jgi:hypothetical protein
MTRRTTVNGITAPSIAEPPPTGIVPLDHDPDAVIAAILAEMQSEAERHAFQFIPTKIGMPSGKVEMFSLSDGDSLAPGWTGIIAVSQMARAYWPAKTSNEGQMPFCSSPDTLVGHVNETPDEVQMKDAQHQPTRHPAIVRWEVERSAWSTYTQPYDCARCPLSAWKSDDRARGQACKELRRLLVLVDGWNTPALLTLPPTSITIFDAYASARSRKPGQAYFTARTKFELLSDKNRDGTKFYKIKLSFVEQLPPDEIATVMAIRTQFAELVRTMNITGDDYAVVPPEPNSDVPF